MIHEDRRSFLGWAVHALGALFALVLGLPALAYLADARNRPAPQRGYRRVQGVNLSDWDGVPKQGVIRDVRRDAWNVSEDVVGRVWVIKAPDGTVKAFSTICPHLGCSINLDPTGGFTCPCHGGRFNADGSLNTRVSQNPAPRGMDSLKARRDPNDPNALEVIYENFYQGRHDKVVKT